jgi:hypothetical protein
LELFRQFWNCSDSFTAVQTLLELFRQLGNFWFSFYLRNVYSVVYPAFIMFMHTRTNY